MRLMLILAVLMPSALMAQNLDDPVDCSDEINRDDPACLGLPPLGDGPPITNVAPFLAPLAGLGLLAGLGGGGAATSTTSTTSTTGN